MKKYASLCVLISAIFFALGGLLIKIAPWSSLALLSARSIIGFSIITLFLIITKHKFVFNKTVLLAALANSCTGILYSFANKMTTAGNTIVLQFTMPIYVIILTAIINKKKPTSLEMRTCLFVFVGIFLFFVDSLSSGNMLGNILALISGISYALLFFFNGREESDPFSSIQISLLISAIIGLPGLLKTDIVNSSPKVLIAVICLGVFQQAFGHILLSIGIKETSAVAASLLSGLEPVLNPVLVAIFCGEMLTPLSLVGAIIVLVTIISYNVVISKTKEKA